MSRGKPVLIGERLFASKKAAADFVRRILYAYPVGFTVSDSDSLVLRDLLDAHPEAAQKVGVGVASFSVEQNDGSRGFWLTRTDGTRTDWSFLACLTPPSRRAEAMAAMRAEVREQIAVVRTMFLAGGYAPHACPVTGDVLRTDNFHIDHVPPFEELANGFLDGERLTPEDVAVLPTSDGATETRMSDRGLAARWQEYHRTRAHLRPVSVRANLSVLRRGRL